MPTVYQAGLERVFTVDFVDGEGAAITPVLASYSLEDQNGEVVVADTAIDVSGAPASTDITVTAAQNTVAEGDIRGFRTLAVTFEDALGNQYQQRMGYVIELAEQLEVGVNAFARYEHFVLLLQEMPTLKQATAASERSLKMALINAYYNIGSLGMDFTAELDTFDLYQDRVNMDPDLACVYSSLDLGVSELLELPASTLLKLKRATLIEADSILGGNPVEDRRRMGLMSHSAGESAHFLRPTKPVDLPVSKETARALSPLVRYSLKAGR